MKKASIAALMAACLMIGGAACAQGATLRLDGAIEAGQTLTVFAPYSGMTSDFSVRAGDEIAAGETLFTVSATEVTADCDGVVAALYAQRAPLYARFADAVIDNNGTPEETVRKILEVLA